jgi:hypothetical protein
MPDADGEISPEPTSAPDVNVARQKIINALVAHGAANPQCPLCHRSAFSVGHFVPLSVVANQRDPVLGGRGYPMIALICQTCGGVQLVNLKILGFTEADLDAMRIELQS